MLCSKGMVKQNGQRLSQCMSIQQLKEVTWLWIQLQGQISNTLVSGEKNGSK